MNICYNTKHISKLSWLLNAFSSSHLRVNVNEAKGNSFVWRTVINLRQPWCVPLRLSCYSSQIRCVWVSTRPQEDPGIKVSWSLSLPQPNLNYSEHSRGEKRAQVFHPQRRCADTYSKVSDTKSVCVFFLVEILFVEHQMLCCIDWQSLLEDWQLLMLTIWFQISYSQNPTFHRNVYLGRSCRLEDFFSLWPEKLYGNKHRRYYFCMCRNVLH